MPRDNSYERMLENKKRANEARMSDAQHISSTLVTLHLVQCDRLMRDGVPGAQELWNLLAEARTRASALIGATQAFNAQQ